MAASACSAWQFLQLQTGSLDGLASGSQDTSGLLPKFAHVSDLVPGDGPHRIVGQRHGGHGLTAQRDELDLVRPTVSMHEHNSAEISLAQFLLGHVAGEHYGVEFLDHE